MRSRLLVCPVFAIAAAFAQTTAPLDTITPDSLRAEISYLASDQLAGRATPSHGLGLAADYIADHFRRANLKPAAPNGSYFQTTKFQGQKVRNVAAILEGSDPMLRDQFVILSAHYDHLGERGPGMIFHGANDNASGTATVMEIATALSRMNPHPRRGILFLTFWGEEKGLLGSHYYVAHPLVPLKNTIAEINLEQLGRTDDVTGNTSGTITFTGVDYTDLAELMAGPAAAEGVKINHRPDAEGYFNRSDNFSFAKDNVVDTTIAVALEFPGYHSVTDTVAGIDFPNLAKVDRAIAAGLLRLADEPQIPHWNKPPAARQPGRRSH